MLYQILVNNSRINGVWNSNIKDIILDALVYFSDTRFTILIVYKSVVRKFIINVMFQRNIGVFRKCNCFVKTPTVAKKLKDLRI